MRLINIIYISIIVLSSGFSVSAQNSLNSNPDALLGDYFIDHAQYKCKVHITHDADNVFTAQIFHVENPIDPETGKILTDIKNPNKALRNTPCNRIVLLYDIRYNEKKKCWDGGKVYDPTYGIKANATVEFVPDGRLKVKGSLFGISDYVYWIKL